MLSSGVNTTDPAPRMLHIDFDSQWAASSEKKYSNTSIMRRFISSYPCTKYQSGLCSLFIHSVASNDSLSGSSCSDCVDAQANLGIRCPHMPEDTLSHNPANFDATIYDCKRAI